MTEAAELVQLGLCSWEVVTAGKHHACGMGEEGMGGEREEFRLPVMYNFYPLL